jgi:polyisoprenyl-phosphate glycosyltransferase
MSNSSKSLSIVIPCYNEGLSIETLISNCIQNISNEIEIILVDNGSTDGTFQKIINSKIPSNIIPLRIEKNIGYGNGILIGLKCAKGRIVSWTHADLQTDVSDVIKGFELYRKELDNKTCVVKGERKNRILVDSFFTILMGIYCSIILRKWLFDINAQPKIFHKDFLNKFENPPLDFSLDLYIYNYFKSNQIDVKTIPVFFKKRLYGNAKGGGTLKGKIKLIFRTLDYIHKLKP